MRVIAGGHLLNGGDVEMAERTSATDHSIEIDATVVAGAPGVHRAWTRTW